MTSRCHNRHFAGTVALLVVLLQRHDQVDIRVVVEGGQIGLAADGCAICLGGDGRVVDRLPIAHKLVIAAIEQRHGRLLFCFGLPSRCVSSTMSGRVTDGDQAGQACPHRAAEAERAYRHRSGVRLLPTDRSWSVICPSRSATKRTRRQGSGCRSLQA